MGVGFCMFVCVFLLFDHTAFLIRTGICVINIPTHFICLIRLISIKSNLFSPIFLSFPTSDIFLLLLKSFLHLSSQRRRPDASLIIILLLLERITNYRQWEGIQSRSGTRKIRHWMLRWQSGRYKSDWKEKTAYRNSTVCLWSQKSLLLSFTMHKVCDWVQKY